MSNDNIVNLVPSVEKSSDIPVSTYMIVDMEQNDYYATGFLIFTTSQVAVMRETDKGALPVFVMPMSNVRFVELVDESEAEDEEVTF